MAKNTDWNVKFGEIGERIDDLGYEYTQAGMFDPQDSDDESKPQLDEDGIAAATGYPVNLIRAWCRFIDAARSATPPRATP
jgi:hypothetical protein